jgi:Tol biopolymer transport system component
VLNLYTLDADGSGLTCLTQDMAVSRSALKFDYSINWHFTTNWSRDGARIVFSGPGVDDKNDIYIFDLSKKMLRNITSSPDDEKQPVWAYYREGYQLLNREALAGARRDQQW